MKALLASSTIVVLIGISSGAQALDKSAAARGRQTFVRVGCSECHGTQGQGGVAGATLAPKTLPLEAMVQFVRATGGRMPAYSAATVSDAELGDIHAYLTSLPAPKSPDSIPALKGLKDTP